MRKLLKLVNEYKESLEMCDQCSELFLSSGCSDKVTPIMNNMYTKRQELFDYAGNITKE